MWSGSGHAVPLRSLRKLKASKIHQKNSKMHRKEFQPEEEDRQNQRACSENHKISKEKQKNTNKNRKIDKTNPRSIGCSQFCDLGDVCSIAIPATARMHPPKTLPPENTKP